MTKTIRWRWGVISALAITLLSIFPQLYLRRDRGREWNGSHAFFYTDEPFYAAYLNALIDGRPRRSDPYSGRDDSVAHPRPESFFSIQSAPAYLVALPARALGISTATAFILIAPLVAFATALCLFWFFTLLLQDERAAAAFVPFVLCLGILISGEGLLQAFLGQRVGYIYLPFLRRYVPAVAFPFFIAFFPLTWHALTKATRRGRLMNGLLAGVAFSFCVYSYFFLWTAAIAWLGLVLILWLIARPERWRGALEAVALIAAIALVALGPYAILVSHRTPFTDQVQELVNTHSFDLSRPIEVFALVILLALFLAISRGHIRWRDPRILITIAFALLPFVVFNQQVISGRSLQPMHYEQFVVSYTTLIAAALTINWLVRTRSATQLLSTRLLLPIVLLAYGWGFGETWLSSRRAAEANIDRDEAYPLGLRLRQIARNDPDPKSKVVFALPFYRSNTLPMTAPQPVLWAQHMFFSPTVSKAEHKERFFQYLYYSGVDAATFANRYTQEEFVRYALFGLARANPRLSLKHEPITPAELDREARDYATYVASFDANRAATPTLSYLIVPANQQTDILNLERWYTRDAGERIGSYWLYRLTLRTDNRR